jgi:hypothetical protein
MGQSMWLKSLKTVRNFGLGRLAVAYIVLEITFNCLFLRQCCKSEEGHYCSDEQNTAIISSSISSLNRTSLPFAFKR